MSRATELDICELEYRDIEHPPANDSGEEPPPISNTATGISEEEVERRITEAREIALAEAKANFAAQREHESEIQTRQIAHAIRAFTQERHTYFAQVETDVVRVALSIARKILQRESEIDPALVAVLVRIALEKLENSSIVRIRVARESAPASPRPSGRLVTPARRKHTA